MVKMSARSLISLRSAKVSQSSKLLPPIIAHIGLSASAVSLAAIHFISMSVGLMFSMNQVCGHSPAVQIVRKYCFKAENTLGRSK